jgi:hypothetical protein
MPVIPGLITAPRGCVAEESLRAEPASADRHSIFDPVYSYVKSQAHSQLFGDLESNPVVLGSIVSVSERLLESEQVSATFQNKYFQSETRRFVMQHEASVAGSRPGVLSPVV